jgi:hypothetical protein
MPHPIIVSISLVISSSVSGMLKSTMVGWLRLICDSWSPSWLVVPVDWVAVEASRFAEFWMKVSLISSPLELAFCRTTDGVILLLSSRILVEDACSVDWVCFGLLFSWVLDFCLVSLSRIEIHLPYSEMSIPLQADQVSKPNLFSKQGDVNFGGRGYYQ